MKKHSFNKILKHPSKEFHYYVSKKVIKFVLLHLFFVVFFAFLATVFFRGERGEQQHI